MDYEKNYKQRDYKSISYYLSPKQLEELQKKYGQPGEIAPGRPAPKKRKKLDARLSEMDRREKNLLDPGDNDFAQIHLPI